MALSEKQKQRRADAVAPYLEDGETVKASFLAQTPVPPWVFFLIASYVFIFMQKYRVVAATERNIYVMENAALRSYKFKGVAYKAPLASAQIEFAGSWMTIDGGPKLWVPPFGPIKRGLKELQEYVESARGGAPAQTPPAAAVPPPAG